MNVSYWQSEIEKLEENRSLRTPSNLQLRMQALQMLDQLFKFASTPFGFRQDYLSLLRRGASLQEQLVEVNRCLFKKLRTQISQQGLRGDELRSALNQFTTYRPDQQGFFHSGDGLDQLVKGIVQTTIAPEPLRDAVLEMIHLEMTPMSVVLELSDRILFDDADIFVDIGSGLGEICLLIHLLKGVGTRGIEIEPAYVDRAKEVAAHIIGDSNKVSFELGDARSAEYNRGTIFFLFTPFTGQIFRSVTEKIRKSLIANKQTNQGIEIKKPRPLICTHGDITLEVAQLPWLHVQHPADLHPSRLALFEVDEDV